ncbi:uncharacterized protein LOC110267641 [Arachis ipaensis]|uniref:uncharacterized protein LOC110267641 n=1 Tax=Arachis ipaensis TaxID=130454 RepID=UPI000A2B4E57|nr:uncharacterized protein LOC110267641 [Arachis ipaensis]
MWLPVVASKKAILAWWACDEMKVVTSKEWFCGSGSGLLLRCRTHFLDLYLFPCSFLLVAAHLLLLSADALLVRKASPLLCAFVLASLNLWQTSFRFFRFMLVPSLPFPLSDGFLLGREC